MKFCTHCGAEIMDEAVICPKCGCKTETEAPKAKTSDDDTMKTIIKVFMIIACVSMGWLLIPLAWCLPITINVFRKLNAGEPITTGTKVCTLLFVSLVAGIMLLCSDDL